MRASLAAAVVGGVLAAFAAAGCADGEPVPCDAEERQAQAPNVAPMDEAVGDSIVRTFEGRARIQAVELVQEVCLFRATVRVDSFATRRYAERQGVELVRALKQRAPNETVLLKKTGEMIGEGVYDYVVVFDRGADGRNAGNRGADRRKKDQKKPWMRIVKEYDATRVHWTR